MEDKNPFELAGELETKEKNPFELAGELEVKKKEVSPTNTTLAPPTGGKVGASEIPSTGNSPFFQKAKERAEQGEPTVLSVKKETVKEVGQPSYTPTKEEELKAPTQKQFEQQALPPAYEKETALDINKKQTQVATERSKALDELIKSKKEAQSSYEKVRNLDSQIESFEPQFEKFKTTAEAFQPDIQEYKNLTSKIAEIKKKSKSFVLEYNNEYQKIAPKLESYKLIFENEKLPNEKRQDAYENYKGIFSILKNKEKLLDQAVAQNEQGIGDLEVRAKSFDETIKKATANQAGFSQLYSQYKSLIDERNKSAEGLGVYEKRMSDAQNQIKQKLFEQSQLEDVRQQKLEKEYSTWQNLIESLPKMGIEAVAGVSDMLNVLGFFGDQEFPENNEQIREEVRANIDKLRKFGDSFITQELPKNYEKLFEGQFSLKKLANAGFNAIASTVPTIAAGFIGGPAAGVAAGAGMAFGESKEIMKEAGLTEEQAEAAAFGLSIPIGLLENYGAEDIVKLFSKEAVEYSTKIFLKNIAGRTLTKEQLFNEAKNTIGQIIKDGAPQLLKEGVKESGTEVSQGAVNEVAKQSAQEFTGVDLDENMSWSDYLKEQAEVRGEEVIGGFIGGTSMQTIGLGIKSAGEGIFPTFNPSAYQKALELLDPSKMEAFSQEVQQEVQDKVLTQEQADLAFRNIQLIQETNKLIPATINNKDLRTEALNLLIEKKETQKEIEGKDEALVAPQKARIEEINKRLSDIANGKEEEVVTPTVTLNKNTTPTEEKYGTIDRGDGKGIVDLTRAEYEAEVAKQGGVEREEVKPMVTEVQFTTKQRERRDQEIEEVQQLRSDLGQDVELINDIPSFVDDIVDRIDLGMMVAPEMAKDAILELDKQFDKLQAYRNDPSRTHTTAQIDAMIDVLGAVKSEIQDYQIKQQENGQQQQTTATKTEPTTTPTQGVEAGKDKVAPTTEEEKGESIVPSKTDKAYQEAQGVTERISKAHPEASVLIIPKGDDLSLTALYVGKEKRGKGIGSGVLESVKAEADKLGKKVVLDATNELDSETDLERLGNFYERNGFVKVGENKFEYTPKETPQAGSVGVGDIEAKKDELERKYGKRFSNEETYYLIKGTDGNYYINHGDRGKSIKSYKFQTEEQAKKFAEKEGIELLTIAKQGVGFTSENKAKYDAELKAIEQSLKAPPQAGSVGVVDVETKQQIENFGVNKADVEPVHSVISQVFQGLKKAGLTTVKTVGEWVGIDKGSQTDNSLKQIIGEKGASQLENAEKVLSDLSVAKEMEAAGEDAKTIRLATGWEKGRDKKWKFEIVDIRALNRAAFNKAKSGKVVSLYELLGDNIIFTAYPKFKNIKVKFGEESFYNAADNTITLSNLFTSLSAKSTLIHELQHAIQYVEGFAFGTTGGREMMAARAFYTDAISQKLFNENKEYRELYNKASDLPYYVSDTSLEINKEREKIDNRLNDIFNDYIEKNPINQEEVKAKAEALYYNNKGEKESRNVQARVYMSIAERRDKMLSETEDIDRAQQIIIRDAIEMKAEVKSVQPLFKDAQAQYRIENGKNIVEAIKDFDGSPEATVALTHEIMHPTVVAIIDGAKEGNEVGAKHTQTIVNEYNKANPNSKVTTEELIKGNDAFKDGTTSKQYRQVQEFIAQSWEKYHTEGAKGFSAEFQKVLDQITEAFKAVYKSITGKELTPELRKMFDEILGKEQSIKETQKATENEKKPTQEENGQPLPEGVSGVRTETEERKTSAELRAEEKEVRSTIDNAVANFYAINEATKRSEKREAAKEFRQNLEKMPTVKNVFDNIKSIFAQLEAEGIITKSKDCP